MNRNYEIVAGIYLVLGSYELDLHNNFDFKNLEYSIAERKLVLSWEHSKGDWVSLYTPKALTIEFKEVSEFRFWPRDSEIPFTQDDCINSFGYWADEEWAEGVIIVVPNEEADPHWLTAIDFILVPTLCVGMHTVDGLEKGFTQ